MCPGFFVWVESGQNGRRGCRRPDMRMESGQNGRRGCRHPGTGAKCGQNGRHGGVRLGTGAKSGQNGRGLYFGPTPESKVHRPATNIQKKRPQGLLYSFKTLSSTEMLSRMSDWYVASSGSSSVSTSRLWNSSVSVSVEL